MTSELVVRVQVLVKELPPRNPLEGEEASRLWIKRRICAERVA